jgi:hypothetical protein
VVIGGVPISKLPATVNANFARRAKIDDRTNPEFVDDAIDPFGRQAVQSIAAKKASPPQPHPPAGGISTEVAEIGAAR